MKRFDLDAAIIFSDILMIPYGLNQKVEFKKFGPELGELDYEDISKVEEVNLLKNIQPVYDSINEVSQNKIIEKKDLIGLLASMDIISLYD